MGIAYNTSIVKEGLVHLLEASKVSGTNPQILVDPISKNNWTANNFSIGNSATFNTFLSNCDSTGAGTSNIVIAPTSALTTGSITFILWFNLKNIPINVGSNNNWRGLVCTNTGGTSGSPLTMVLEQGRVINFSTTHATGGYRRHLNGNFTPINADADGWQMVSYTYQQSTGTAICYKNNQLVLSGPMTNSGGGSPIAAGDPLVYGNYTSGASQTGFRIFGGTATTANNTGNGVVPGELSNVMIYNRALSFAEIKRNFEALRGRYGI